MQPILEIQDLRVSFRMYDRGLAQRDLAVLSDLTLSVRPGEVVAVAGSSGSGKSLLASAILGLLPANATRTGEMRYKGEPLTQDRQKRLRGSEIALVPQSLEEALEALEQDNEFLTAGDVFTEDLIETWIRYKREEEIEVARLRPTPTEFELYFSI